MEGGWEHQKHSLDHLQTRIKQYNPMFIKLIKLLYSTVTTIYYFTINWQLSFIGIISNSHCATTNNNTHPQLQKSQYLQHMSRVMAQAQLDMHDHKTPDDHAPHATHAPSPSHTPHDASGHSHHKKRKLSGTCGESGEMSS